MLCRCSLFRAAGVPKHAGAPRPLLDPQEDVSSSLLSLMRPKKCLDLEKEPNQSPVGDRSAESLNREWIELALLHPLREETSESKSLESPYLWGERSPLLAASPLQPLSVPLLSPFPSPSSGPVASPLIFGLLL